MSRSPAFIDHDYFEHLHDLETDPEYRAICERKVIGGRAREAAEQEAKAKARAALEADARSKGEEAG